MKIFGTPALVVVQTYMYGVLTDYYTKLTLIPICIGSLISVFTDLETNLLGTFWAVLAVASNTMYTIVRINILISSGVNQK